MVLPLFLERTTLLKCCCGTAASNTCLSIPFLLFFSLFETGSHCVDQASFNLSSSCSRLPPLLLLLSPLNAHLLPAWTPLPFVRVPPLFSGLGYQLIGPLFWKTSHFSVKLTSLPESKQRLLGSQGMIWLWGATRKMQKMTKFNFKTMVKGETSIKTAP